MPPSAANLTPRTLLDPTLRVGTLFGPLCGPFVFAGTGGSPKELHAERGGRRSHAERGNEEIALSSRARQVPENQLYVFVDSLVFHQATVNVLVASDPTSIRRRFVSDVYKDANGQSDPERFRRTGFNSRNG